MKPHHGGPTCLRFIGSVRDCPWRGPFLHRFICSLRHTMNIILPCTEIQKKTMIIRQTDQRTKFGKAWSLGALRIVFPSGRGLLPRNLVRVHSGWGTKISTKQVSGANRPQSFRTFSLFARFHVSPHAAVPFSRLKWINPLLSKNQWYRFNEQ